MYLETHTRTYTHSFFDDPNYMLNRYIYPLPGLVYKATKMG